MEFFQELCAVVSHTNLTETVHDIWIHSQKIAGSAKPGQFVNIVVPGFFLRRPISICEVSKDTVRLVFEERGEGTKALGNIKPGDELDILGPLGSRGFYADKYKSAILVGGGIGTPPLKFCRNMLNKSAAVLGFRNDKQVIMAGEFANVQVCTDDGSRGHHGNIAKPLEKFLKTGSYEAVLACGPKPMLKTVVALAEKYNVPCEISLEERMACGVGACLGCACKTKAADGGDSTSADSSFAAHVNAVSASAISTDSAALNSPGGNVIFSYPKVCKDGPVFDGRAVVL